MAINAIGDAVSGLGAIVPEGSTYEDIVEIIKGSLFYKAPSSAMTLILNIQNTYSTGITVPLNQVSGNSGSAFTYKNNGVSLNHKVKVTITASLKAQCSTRYAQGVWFYICKNGSTIATKETTLPSDSQSTKHMISLSWSGTADVGDLFTLWVQGGTANKSEVYMSEFKMIVSGVAL